MHAALDSEELTTVWQGSEMPHARGGQRRKDEDRDEYPQQLASKVIQGCRQHQARGLKYPARRLLHPVHRLSVRRRPWRRGPLHPSGEPLRGVVGVSCHRGVNDRRCLFPAHEHQQPGRRPASEGNNAAETERGIARATAAPRHPSSLHPKRFFSAFAAVPSGSSSRRNSSRARSGSGNRSPASLA